MNQEEMSTLSGYGDVPPSMRLESQLKTQVTADACQGTKSRRKCAAKERAESTPGQGTPGHDHWATDGDDQNLGQQNQYSQVGAAGT